MELSHQRERERKKPKMKLLGKQLDKNNAGRIKLLPQEPEDLWHAFNIIVVGDRVVTKTIRFAFAPTRPF